MTTLDPANKSSAITLSGGNLVATSNLANVGAPARVRSTTSRSDDRYFEVLIGAQFNAASQCFGVVIGSVSMAGTNFSVGTTGFRSGIKFENSGTGTSDAAYNCVVGDRIGFLVSPSRDKLWASINGVWIGDPVAGTGGLALETSTNDFYALGMVTPRTTGTQNVLTYNFGATDGSGFTYPVPSGGLGWDQISSGITGSASGTLPLSGAATGTLAGAGNAAGSLPLSGSAAGSVVASGLANGTLPLTGASVGLAGASAVANGSLPLSGAGTAISQIAASGSGLLPLSGSSTGTAAVVGAAGGVITLAGSAAGVSTPVTTGTAAGMLSLFGAGAATLAVSAVAAGTLGLIGSSVATTGISGSTSGTFGLFGNATGTVPGSAITGQAAGFLQLSGAAVGTGNTPSPIPAARIITPLAQQTVLTPDAQNAIVTPPQRGCMIILAGYEEVFMSSEYFQWPDKLAPAVIFYGVDWARRLGEATIVSHDFELVSGGVTLTPRAPNGTETSVEIAGGTAGSIAVIIASAVASDGEIHAIRVSIDIA